MGKPSLWNSIASLRLYSSSSALNRLKNGDVLKQSRVFSVSDISRYSELSLDFNPLHFDAKMARDYGFVDVPVPGLLVASLFPRIIASHFPGTVYAKQSLEFRSPAFAGDEIICEVKATNIREMAKQKYVVKFATTCFKTGDIVVIRGDAIAILPSLDAKQVE
ncbi:uncharacterized protein LOC127244216 [Andrographis paniculata]|uniref:uncharacterized protein LOC127244216 n=1 Tax=Andrographis paniculata TaxID=175694 RepID=UPI0021E6F29B|nr:uncharacterized protein LOC127244216 [Andrographis paniculata]